MAQTEQMKKCSGVKWTARTPPKRQAEGSNPLRARDDIGAFMWVSLQERWNTMAGPDFPSKFVGYDISEEAIIKARSDGQRLGNKNVSFGVNDVSNLQVIMKTDTDLVVAFDAIHDQRDPASVN